MRVAVVSSCYGSYDHISSPLPQSIDVDWVMVTDGDSDAPGWHTIVEPRRHMHPRLAAKVAKCRPDLYTDADITIWIDSSFRITSPLFAEWCVASLGDGTVAQIVHPERDSIMDEACVSELMAKYQGQAVRAQAHHYIAGGHPDRWGLWATGLMVRRRSVEFGDAWLIEQTRWTYQDQISEPAVLRDLGIRPVSLDGPLWSHPMFTMTGHRSEQ